MNDAVGKDIEKLEVEYGATLTGGLLIHITVAIDDFKAVC